ncbi:MAG: hypothetical protein IKL37_03425 [Alphaproteobacteria bacterium]|nr:hypothetical protein [Alphaproteobacteria bacterium]MBR6685293.1 hypothetical protein [Alphaproteobacteria bacterium]
MKKKQSQQNKQLFSKGRTALLTLLASLGVVTAVGMNRTPVHNDGPDNPAGTKEAVVEYEPAPEMNLPNTIEGLQTLLRFSDNVLADLDAKLASGELNAEERFEARNTRKAVLAERAEAQRRLSILLQEKSNGR